MKEFKSFYKTVEGNEGRKCRYPTRLDVYGCGCAHNCKYCYARSLLEFRGAWDIKEPRAADVEKIERKIGTLKRGSVVRLGGMTDCFQPCERERKITYQTIRLLNRYGIHYLIVTKSDLVASDEYMQILDKDLAHIQITVTSTDDKTALAYEDAPPSSSRIKAIEKLEAAGFDVQIRLSPFISEFIDTDVIKEIKCQRAVVEFLRVNPFIKKIFDLDYTRYTHKEGGYRHLPLEEKKRLIKEIASCKVVSVCEDCDEAYEYWKNHVNTFPDDCCNLRFSDDVRYMGNMRLTQLEKTAFLCSSTTDEEVVRAAERWAERAKGDETCIVSGFQSEAERAALKVLLKTDAKIIMVLAKKIFDRSPVQYQKAIKEGRMLLIAPFDGYENKVTKANAQKRNEYLLNRADKIVVGYVSPGGMLDKLLNEQRREYELLVGEISTKGKEALDV